ncbi:MAG: hypothetical protein HFF18_14150 [Oscillospiraceae bacterium]|nr:hypothetical protein [Oscillospiraceae bacterium]
MKNNEKGLTPFYIILVPIILVAVLLNSGILQKLLPAVSVCGEELRVVQYNYYYFSVYNNLLAAGTDGFDPAQNPENQTRPDGSSWRDWICAQAEKRLAEAVYFDAQAQKDGYHFTGEELAPVDARLAEWTAQAASNNLSVKNYFVAYYGAGMTEDVMRRELSREVRAAAYRRHLEETCQLTEEEINAWLAQNSVEDYATANLQLIVLEAAADRFSGEVEERQLEDLEERLRRLTSRYEADPDAFSRLAAAYSAWPEAWENGGTLVNQDREALPAAVSAWCFDQPAPGAVFSTVDRSAGEGYLAVYTGPGVSAAWQMAINALQAGHVAGEVQAALEAAPAVYHSWGMRFAGK